MLRTVPILALLALVAAPAAAQGTFVPAPGAIERPARPLTGIYADVARALPFYGYPNVDVAGLSVSQAAHIRFLVQSGRPEGDIRGQIGAVLRRGLLQRALDRVIR